MAPATLDTVLTGLADDGATGALRVGKEGTVYLDRGRVSYVECAATPGADELMTAAGRISAGGMRGVRQAAGPRGEGGDLLVHRGVLSRGELQFCVLGATLDAAFSLLRPVAVRSRFKADEAHWLGVHWFFDVPGLLRECARRRALLDQAWPHAEVDGRPVTPVGHVPGTHVVLTSLQWEVLLAADGTASPAALARRLGRPVYSVLLAVRRLAAAGLIAVPAVPEKPDVPEKRGGPEGRGGREGARTQGAPALPRRAGDRAVVSSADRPAAQPATSPTTSPGVFPDGEASPLRVTGDATDVNLLIRLRDALEAL